jgi:hypothetical protein
LMSKIVSITLFGKMKWIPRRERHTTVLVVEQAVWVIVTVLGGTLMQLHAAVIRSGEYTKHLLIIHFGGCGFPP